MPKLSFYLDFCLNIYEKGFLSNCKHSENNTETNNVPLHTKFKVFSKIFVVERGSNMLQSGSSQINNSASDASAYFLSRKGGFSRPSVIKIRGRIGSRVVDL